jgi:peroxiredoxin family protein
VSNINDKSKKSPSVPIKSKDLKIKFRDYTSNEKAIRVIAGIITGILIIIMSIMIIISVVNQQYINILIYVAIIGFGIIPNELIEKKIRKNAQKRKISGLIEKKVEKERIKEKPVSYMEELIEKKDKILIFISYATKDADIFKVKDIAKALAKYKKIVSVLYWQEHMKDNIIKYMNDNLGKCDAMLLFCSPNALRSEPVEKEWTAADMMKKPIIPVFNDPDHIPPLLKTRLGIKFDPFDFKKNVDEIYNLLLKKIE